MYSQISPLTCPLCNSSLAPSMGRQKRERRGRRRTTFPDQAESKDVPAVELEPDSDLLFQNMTDLVVSAISACVGEERTRLEDVMKEVCARKYFDSMYQAFVPPLGITREHIAFIVAHDPVVSKLYRVEDGVVTEC